MMRRSMAGSSVSPRGTAAIVGVGPKLGRAIARKFARKGYTVAILSRDLVRLSEFAEEIAREEKAQVFAIRIDCSDSKSVREAFEGVLSLGFVEVLIYNAHYEQQLQQQQQPMKFAHIAIDSFEKSLAVSTVGAFHCAQQVLPGMVERGRGTILFTGCSASLNGLPGLSLLCCGKFALRGLSQCLSREFHRQGVHVAHVIINGIIGGADPPPRASTSAQRTGIPIEEQVETGMGAKGDNFSREELRWQCGRGWSMDADVVAQTYWQLHIQDRCAWTQEIDLRPPSSYYPFSF